ncbi:MAG: Asp-tRNA(Asn)/Glu-tRNA(Gln) amidotransferase subunit GatA [Candidatus Bathyarchaeota archaeon]|nr:MAG: Asp-tRNA(Asn)/Glu-tRNA(Gln) amidotransferase subunit GatA [Candidatus Bathyarchaeota archaeon]
MTKLHATTAKELVERIRNKEVTAEEYVLSVFERIHRLEDSIHAFVTVTKEKAIEKAREIDKKISEGEPLGRLAGVAIAVKDNICTKDTRTTCSSKMLESFVPPYDATVIERIKKEDGVIIGKTNMDEFAMGTSTETSYFGPTHNPWNLSRVPGGSSGGSAAAIAAGEATLALGADTGGSIRCPASYCSVVGVKPTYGLVSRYGLIAYANSLDQIGPMARNVYDCALFLSIIAGHDPSDSTSAKAAKRDYTKFLKSNVEGFKIGIPEELFGEGTSGNVEKQVWAGVHKLEELGASCKETSIPNLEYALAAYYIIAMSEASSNLARYDGLRYGYRTNRDNGDWSTVYSKNRRIGFGAEVRRRIILGTYALSTGYYDKYYLKALKIRTIIRRDFEKAFKEFNVLISPTMPIPPFKIGEKIQDPLALYMCDVDTVSMNLAGLPTISVPCGFTAGLPIGMQIIAPPLREDLMLQVAYTFEQNTPYKNQKPPLK